MNLSLPKKQIILFFNRGHCQVPCGILNDPKLLAEIREACATIRKAMVQINELTNAGLTAQSMNQITRWVNTKEEHAIKIINLMANYCLCQRMKPVGEEGSPFNHEKDYIDALKGKSLLESWGTKSVGLRLNEKSHLEKFLQNPLLACQWSP